MMKLYHIHVYTYSRSFLIQIFICAHTNTFSRGSSESTLDERYLFITIHNKIYVNNRQKNRILLRHNETWTIINITNLINSWSMFITENDEIFLDNGYSNGRVDKWTLNGTYYGPVMQINSSCTSLFVDEINNLYCSLVNEHRILKTQLTSSVATVVTVAGTGCPGPTPNMLDHPNGIFVDKNLNLYVADTDNNRIQCFLDGETHAQTMAGFGASIFVLLNQPTSVTLDASGYMFIVDSGNHRIIRSIPNGFTCLFGCSDTNGASANQLSSPQTMAFDKYGNIFVTDFNNHRIQKINLITNTCRE